MAQWWEHLLPTWVRPGFDSWTRRRMWVEFVVGSLLALRGFSPSTLVFPTPQKPTFPNSNLIRNSRATGLSFTRLLSVTLIKQSRFESVKSTEWVGVGCGGGTYLAPFAACSISNCINDSTCLWSLLASCSILSATLVQSKLFPVSLLSQILLLWNKPSRLFVEYRQALVSDDLPVCF